MEVVEDELLLVLVDLLHLSKNDVPLPVNGSLVQLGVQQNVAQNLDGLGHVLLENLSVVDSLLPAGVSIQVPPHVLNLNLQLLLRPLAGALERHVLEEVGRTVVLGGLEPAPSINEDADGGGLGPGRSLRGNTKSPIEGCDTGLRSLQHIRRVRGGGRSSYGAKTAGTDLRSGGGGEGCLG